MSYCDYAQAVKVWVDEVTKLIRLLHRKHGQGDVNSIYFNDKDNHGLVSYTPYGSAEKYDGTFIVRMKKTLKYLGHNRKINAPWPFEGEGFDHHETLRAMRSGG